MEDHQASRWIVEPLRLLDCCQESDGGQALVVTSLERARDLRQPPAVIKAAAQGAGAQQDMMTSYYRDDMTRLPEMGVVARQLWETSGLGPDDMQGAVLYDHFTPFVLYQLEELGFCAWGEAKEFVRDGNIELGGRLPINTHGGQLGEAYIHGMNGIAEGVRQVRGTAVNQIDGPRAHRGHRRHRRPHQRARARRRPLIFSQENTNVPASMTVSPRWLVVRKRAVVSSTHIDTVKVSPGRVGLEKRPSMERTRLSSDPHSVWSRARPVKP